MRCNGAPDPLRPLRVPKPGRKAALVRSFSIQIRESKDASAHEECSDDQDDSAPSKPLDELAPLHVWMTPAWQEEMQRAAQKSLHVSGLFMQSGWTAGPDGVREPRPHHSSGIDVPMKRQAS